MRIDRLEGQMRALTGQMEQLMFQMRQLQDELTRAREDSEFRLRELETGGGSGALTVPSSRESVAGQLEPGAGPLEQQESAPFSSASQELGTPPTRLGTLSVDAAGQPVGASVGTVPGAASSTPLDLSSLTLGGDLDVRPLVPLGDGIASLDPSQEASPQSVYDVGYQQVLRGDYPQAVSTFGDFLLRYPENPLRPNAHFWLGESHFALGDYTPAAEEFLTVFNEFPEDVKVPDALLKLGMSLERLGAQEQACATFGKLMSDYPRAPQIVLDAAAAERTRASC
ncbi:MAG: tol-pal system protein YbgF [Pseudomonadota bacterium]